MAKHFTTFQENEMTMKRDEFGPRNVLSASENTPTKMTSRVNF